MKRLRVLLVDDSPVFARSAIDVLSCDPRLEVIGLARDGQEGVRLAAELAPDLVLMDLALPVLNGLEATRLIKGMASPPAVVLITLLDTHFYRLAAKDAAADGFVAKSGFAEEIRPILESFLDDARTKRSPDG